MTASLLKKSKGLKILGGFLGFLILALFPQGGKSQNITPTMTPVSGQALNKSAGETPMIATAIAGLPAGNGLGPIPTAGTSAAGASSQSGSATNDFSLSPQEEAKILNAIDSEENKSPDSPPAKKANLSYYKPPPVPTGVSVIVLKEGVYLSWNTAPAGSTASSYNVYRSSTPGFGYKQMNLKPLTAAYFMDGPPNSYDNPQNGEDYFYVVTSVDGAGNVSPYSEETTAYPAGMDVPQSTEVLNAIKMAKQTAPEEEKSLSVPEQSVISLKLPADSQLAIQGYKKVDAQIAFQTYNRPNLNGVSNQVNTTTINQELVVNLKGKVGKNVDVNVDYSDVNRAGGVDETKQDISIVYHGDSDSAIQQVSFGDLQLTLPNTEFAGFSKQLFGLEAVLKFDRFQFTSFFAQTKGIAVTKVFTGNTTQVDKTYQDVSFVPFKYFLITRTPAGAAPTGTFLPQNNSEQIWVYNGTTILNPIGTNFIGIWEHWLPGRDYTIDYSTGIITFVRALSYGSQIAVGFTDVGGITHGLNTPGRTVPAVALSGDGSNLGVSDTGYVDNKYFLIKDSTNTTNSLSSNASRSFSPLYLVNYFTTGSDKIIPPQQDPGFLFQIVSQGTNNIVQTGQGGTTGTPYVYNLNLDLNILSVVNTTFASPAAVTYLYFPERPFANLDGIANGTTIVQAGGSAVTDVYSSTNGGTPTSLYYIHLRYKTQLNFFKLDNINILRGSETVYLDGRLMRRDADYFIDYTTGFLDFQDKSILTPNSQIVVTYEYSPFGSFGSNNILGARAEYGITDNFFIGSTFLMSTSQQPTDTPQLGSTPNSLTLFDADTKYEMDRDELASITSVIPGLENWKPPATLKLSGEIAQSYFNPDTYNAQGEQGVAMVDNMEGIDSAISGSLNQTSWLVSSAPDFDFVNSGQPLVSADNNANNRTRFFDDVNGVDFQVNTSTAIPGGGGHVYAQTGQASDVVNVLQFPYSHLSNKTWAGLRQVISTAGTDFSTVQFFQTWLYNDGNDKWIMFDFGVINEDTNGNNVLDSDAVTNQANPNQNYGIPTFYMPGTPWNYGGNKTGFDYLQDPLGDFGFVGLNSNGVTEVSQEGQDNGVYITENMNGTGILNGGADSYFEYGVRANWTGWQLVKIPVDLTVVTSGTSGTTANGISYFFSNPTTASAQVVRTLRLWATGAGPTSINGTFLTDSISFTHNLWQLQVDPGATANLGVTINPNKFDVNSISQAQNTNYTPNMRFIIVQPGQDQNAIKFNEKSLDISYKLSSADYNPPGNINGSPIYYATRVFQQGLDFTDYQELRLDMQIRSYNAGEIFFVRIGNDQQDYYQYNLTMDSLAASCLDSWGTVVIPLSGIGGNRIKVGTPFINKATQISFGVLSPNAAGGKTGEIWIDNLRSATPNVRTGTARRLNAEMILGEDSKKPFATIDARYREVDSGFTEMDQTSTHFQHSLQYGLDYTSSGIYLFGQPVQSQFSWTDQELYTEPGLLDNPYYIDLPNSQIYTATASIRYTKDLGTEFGRLTSLNLSGNTSSEKDVYQPDYLNEPGVQGNTFKGEDRLSVISTYDMPLKLWFLPIGSNQLTETYTITHDVQTFDFDFLSPYDRHTRIQTYGWTNTTEIFKNLVFTPGYTLSLTDAVGNTNSPGIPGGSSTFTPFVQQYQPKAGLVYRGIPGVIPSVTYSGSNQDDYVDYQDGTRFTNSNNINYSLNVTPGSWFAVFQKMNLTLFGGRTDSATASVPNSPNVRPLSFEEQWLIDPPYDISLLATRSTTDQLNASFKLFDVWDFRPTGSWTDQFSLLYQGSSPTEQKSTTLGLTTIYNKRILTIPWVNFSFNSAQVQYTHTDSTQYDSASPPNISSQSYSDIYAVTFPYEINKFAQGNMRFQATLGFQNGLATTNIPTYMQDYQGSIEYDQKFAPNLVLHVPFTHWKIQLHDAIEFKANFLTEYIENDSDYTYNQIQSQRYRGTIEFDYNALKNLRIGLSGINEYFTNALNPTLSYVLWQINLSGEAKF